MAADVVLACNDWPTNGHLIADCHRLRYLRDEEPILDPTYGEGTWWKEWRPLNLTTRSRLEDGSDFRSLPFSSASFWAIAYDPPYVAKGGRDTSGMKEMDARYGQDDCPATPRLLQQLIDDGLTEMRRLVVPSSRKKMTDHGPNGIVLCKCMDYVSGGELWPGVKWPSSGSGSHASGHRQSGVPPRASTLSMRSQPRDFSSPLGWNGWSWAQ